MDKVKATGTRAEVMHGTAKKTSGGLTKDDLKYNNQGRIVSKKQSARAKRENRLVKAGYVTEKGKFGAKFVGDNKSPKKSPKKSKKSPKKKSPKKKSPKKKSSFSFF